MDFQVDIHYDDVGTDNVKVMEAYGCTGRPVLVEIMVDRTANAAMGTAIDAVTEFQPVP